MTTAGYDEVTFNYDYSNFRVRASRSPDLYRDPDDANNGLASDGLLTAGVGEVSVRTRGEWSIVHVEVRGASAGETLSVDPSAQAAAIVLATPERRVAILDSLGAEQIEVSTPGLRSRLLLEVLHLPPEDVNVDVFGDYGERYRLTAFDVDPIDDTGVWLSQNPSKLQVRALAHRPEGCGDPTPWDRRNWPSDAFLRKTSAASDREAMRQISQLILERGDIPTDALGPVNRLAVMWQGEELDFEILRQAKDELWSSLNARQSTAGTDDDGEFRTIQAALLLADPPSVGYVIDQRLSWAQQLLLHG